MTLHPEERSHTLETRLLRTVVNPLVGDRVTFLATAEETRGHQERVEMVLAPRGRNALHFHTKFVEVFEAKQGVLHIECDGREIVLKPGQTARAPIGSLHRCFNPSDEPIVFQITIVPARDFEKMIRIAFGLQGDGKCTPGGIPKNPLHAAVISRLGESYLPGAPLALQKAVFGCLYAVAKWTGVERRLLDRYC
jgi:mannose-6-phosphate isomerase-like protein (cupin superfamily)